jgi:hypothetical protein
MELTLEVIVDLAGELKDGSRASEKLREKIQGDATLGDIELLLDESLRGSDSYHNRALQDIVNNIGSRLGFEVEYGAYKPSSGNPSHDGLWVSNQLESEEVYLVVESKKSTTYTIDPEHQPGSYMEYLVDERGISPDQVYGLIVAGDDRKLDSLVHSVRGSEYRNRVRVITCDRLFELLSMQEQSELSHGQVAQVLLPMDTVNVGSLVDLMNRIVKESPGGGGSGSDDTPPESADFWDACREQAGVNRNAEGAIQFADEVTYAKALREVVGIAIDRGYLTQGDLPYTAGGQSRALVNSEPKHLSGTEMRRGSEVREGFWVECNHSSDTIEKYIRRFSADFVE